MTAEPTREITLSKLLETAKVLMSIRSEEPSAYACLPSAWRKILDKYPKELYQSYRLHGIQVGVFQTQDEINQYVKDMAWGGKKVVVITDDLVEEQPK